MSNKLHHHVQWRHVRQAVIILFSREFFSRLRPKNTRFPRKWECHIAWTLWSLVATVLRSTSTEVHVRSLAAFGKLEIRIVAFSPPRSSPAIAGRACRPVTPLRPFRPRRATGRPRVPRTAVLLARPWATTLRATATVNAVLDYLSSGQNSVRHLGRCSSHFFGH